MPITQWPHMAGQSQVWIVTALIMLFNGWWMDRWVARESGVERELRAFMKWFRRVLGAVPILSFLVIPFWRWLIERRPSWTLTMGSSTPLTIRGKESPSEETSTARRIQHWLDRQHARLSPVLILALFHFIAGYAILQFAVVEISENRAGRAEWALLTSCVILRAVGASLNGRLLWRSYKDRGLSGWGLIWQIPLAISWFFPWRLAYLQALLGLAFLDRRWQRLRLFQSPSQRPFSSEAKDAEHVGPAWKWFMRQVRFDELNRPRRARTSIARCLTFALVFEMAFVFYVAMTIEAKWPGSSKLIGIPFLLVLLWILVRGLHGAGSMASRVWRNLREIEGNWDDGLVARVRVSLVLATSVATTICGLLQAGDREEGNGVMQLFAVGAFFLAAFFIVHSLVGLIRGRQVDPHVVRWILIFLLLSGCAAVAGSNFIGWCFFFVVALMIPVMMHCFAIWQVGWMINPFRLSDIARPEVPLRVQIRLVGIFASAILPLGALAFPWALKMRRSLEPEFDRLWPL